MDIEGIINHLFKTQEVDIFVKKVDKFDARVIVSYKDTVQLVYIGIHEVCSFTLNGFVFKAQEVLSDIIEKENISEEYAEQFKFRLAGRFMTLLCQDPILKARKDLEKYGGWIS
jgi:hypothetical protein